MRELRIQVSNAERDEVESVLDTRGFDYTTIEDDETHIFVPLPTAAVSTVLDDLREKGLDDDSCRVLTKAEFAQTPRFTELQARYAASVRKLSKEELHGKVREIQWPYQLYYVGSILSVIAATAGFLIDQPALLIGAMVIAPQASSALAAPTGVLLSDWRLFVKSLREQVLSFLLAIVAAGCFSLAVRWAGFVPASLDVTQLELVSLRLSPSVFSTVGAIIAGIVGAFGYTTEQATSLIGVMIAAALIPAAAAVGLAIAWTEPMFGVGAFLLLLVNALAINVGAILTLVVMGYRPNWRVPNHSLPTSVPASERRVVYLLLIGVVLLFAVTGYFTAVDVEFSREVNEEVEATLTQADYQGLSVTSVKSAYGGAVLTSTPTPVTVSLSRTTNEEYPALAPTLERRIERRTGQNVQVTVEFSTVRSSNRRTGDD
ncbi:TIGR00341 family protein [Haloferax namakaokahaiae]|uniref:TIGR00341 family protein n=1 Tax=Haloferax namakaokahaiae TaxID=1748331 RepID=A0ABD5ZD71_9EURY